MHSLSKNICFQFLVTIIKLLWTFIYEYLCEYMQFIFLYRHVFPSNIIFFLFKDSPFNTFFGGSGLLMINIFIISFLKKWWQNKQKCSFPPTSNTLKNIFAEYRTPGCFPFNTLILIHCHIVFIASDEKSIYCHHLYSSLYSMCLKQYFVVLFIIDFKESDYKKTY